jgi:hypothetical protein
MKTLHGVIHGNAIQLDEASGFPEGQKVVVRIEPVPRHGDAKEALEALKRAAGSWADDPDGLDRYLDWNRRQRKGNRREIQE